MTDAAFAPRPDVTFAPCPPSLAGPRQVNPHVQVASARVLVTYPEWSLLVEEGTYATIDWRGDGDLPTWIVDSWAVSIAALQQGLLSLHAALVEIDGHCLALAGASGAGKSTTAMGLHARGHLLLTDDVALVDTIDHAPKALPYARAVHLTEDAVGHLGLDPGTGSPLAGTPGKQAFRPAASNDMPRPLECLIALITVPGTASPRIRQTSGLESFEVVLHHAGRPVTSPAIMGEHRYFAAISELADSIPVFVIDRPVESWTLDHVTGLIEEVARDLP